MNSLSWVEVDTNAIQYNIKQLKSILPAGYSIAAVIKSNAYGHGMIPLARFLQKEKLVEYLAVANDEEALALRKHNITLPIIILSYWNENNLDQLAAGAIALGVYTLEQLEALKRLNQHINIHLKIDTGMHRLGIRPDEVERYAQEIKSNDTITLQGIFSHFAVADEDEAVTKQQLSQFTEVVSRVKRHIDVPFIHTANSAGVLFMNESVCNLMRLGIAMYGLEPSSENPRFKLRPALAWKTRVIQVKNVQAGESISYGLTYQFTKDTLVATLPVGYGDGYDRGFSNCTDVLIRGKRFPVRGRVCMNLTMVEVDADVRAGDEVVLLGKQGDEEITADDLASKTGTINYEVVTRINSEIERIYPTNLQPPQINKLTTNNTNAGQ